MEQGKSEGFDSCEQPSNLTQTEFKSLIFQPVWPSIFFMDDLKQQYGHLLYYIKLCASFQIHRWIQTGVTVGKRSICFKFQIQIQNSLLLPIYSFGHTYIQFVFKYNTIHT